MSAVALPQPHKHSHNVFDVFYARRNRFEKFWQAIHKARLADSSYYHKARIAAINRYFNWSITSLRELTDAQLRQVIEAIEQGRFTCDWRLQSEQPDFNDPETRRRILEYADML
jgi:hypothetical protein